ncbi:hypothetical protein NQ317_006463 [Molorchus minor]|uniref:Uncharacterized protein n=1 Tax=Molorchus minor TaxID=1323400 RepID=A0ABQ9J6Q4_9CUCU|nr:hypothetical protein NQ317_006463 [Molorchus minor]
MNLTDEQFKKWITWLKHLPEIENIEIPRCYLMKFHNWEGTYVQLHIFVDASQNASAVVAYLRIQKDSEIECVLIGAKTHIAPIKLQTMPRLELDGAVLGARFAKNISRELSITINDCIYWSDSVIVLTWIRTEDPRQFCTYVAYRVAEIQDNSLISNWRYIPTKLNVADEATKWTKRPTLKITDTWFKAPKFLYEEQPLWPLDITSETKQEEIMIHHNSQTCEPIIKIENFSKFIKLLRTMGYIYRYIKKLKAVVKKRN